VIKKVNMQALVSYPSPRFPHINIPTENAALSPPISSLASSLVRTFPSRNIPLAASILEVRGGFAVVGEGGSDAMSSPSGRACSGDSADEVEARSYPKAAASASSEAKE